MSELQGQGKVPKVGRLSDPLFKDVSFIKATERLTYDEKNILISLILPFHLLWHKKGRKNEKTNTMAKEGLGGQAVTTAIQLALLGVTIFVVGFAFQKGKDRAGK